jgi:hypothetical protein
MGNLVPAKIFIHNFRPSSQLVALEKSCPRVPETFHHGTREYGLGKAICTVITIAMQFKDLTKPL